MKTKTKQKNRIRDLLEERGMTSRTLAKMIGTSAPHMSRLESGDTPLSIKWIGKIAAALKVNSSDIVDLPFDTKFTRTCDDALLGSVIGWLLEAADKYKVKLSREELTTWTSHVYKGAVETPLAYQPTKFVAFTIVKVIQQVRGK